LEFVNGDHNTVSCPLTRILSFLRFATDPAEVNMPGDLLPSIDLEVVAMAIVHIERPADLESTAFETFTPPPMGDLPRPTLGSVEAWVAPDGAVETGTWEATPGTFARAIVDAEFCHFVRGHATFVTEDGRRFEFKAGDAAYFPPRTFGLWTIHKTLRKTYCIWR
jgi:uncharacterized protein